ncbi:helix-turn-helix domain-containing protein [Streptomyces sp. NBC_00015]
MRPPPGARGYAACCGGPWRSAARAVIVLLSQQGLPAAQVATLLECTPATARRWITRFKSGGVAGLDDRPRCGRPRLGGSRPTARTAALLQRPQPWTVPRLHQWPRLPQTSRRTPYRRVLQVPVWRRPKPVAPGDPARAAVVAAIAKRLRSAR